jgi:hypothetical protein
MLLSVCFLALILLFAAIFYALWRKRYVRASFKGPLSAFLIEFEADDRNRDPEQKDKTSQSTTGGPSDRN